VICLVLSDKDVFVVVGAVSVYFTIQIGLEPVWNRITEHALRLVMAASALPGTDVLILKPLSIDQSVAGAKIPAITFIALLGFATVVIVIQRTLHPHLDGGEVCRNLMMFGRSLYLFSSQRIVFRLNRSSS
jgi:hypothetical protein